MAVTVLPAPAGAAPGRNAYRLCENGQLPNDEKSDIGPVGSALDITLTGIDIDQLGFHPLTAILLNLVVHANIPLLDTLFLRPSWWLT